MSNNKISPCPFCGETPIEITIDGLHAVKCNNPDCWIGPQTSLYTQKETAIIAWAERAEPENKPLTPDELRQSKVRPLWIVDIDRKTEGWKLCEGVFEFTAVGADGREYVYYFCDYGKGWLAYDYPPKEAAPHE